MRRKRIIFVSSAILVLGGIGGCSSVAEDEQKSGKTIEQVQEAHADEWMAIPGVQGTAIVKVFGLAAEACLML